MVICISLSALITITPSAPAKEVPTWAGIEKTPEQLAADKKLIEEVLKISDGNIDEAASRAVELGWAAVQDQDVELAIRRFNQAWLIAPNRGDIYWGFAIATAIRGDKLSTVEEWFGKAQTMIGPDSRLHSDWGRILTQRNEYEAAMRHFDLSINADPKNPEPHIGMIHAALGLGDQATADKHLALYKSLTGQ